MRVFLENYNGVLDALEDHFDDRGELTDNPHEADVFVLWQDVRGVCKDLAQIAKRRSKPVAVMQHGRGATRDYCKPNNFISLADKIMVWGQSEKDRLLSAGISEDRIAVVGCPLFPYLKPKDKDRQGKNILFVPVIAQKEEPENILVYGALRKWEAEKLIENVYENFQQMKRAWAWENNEVKNVALPDGSIEQRVWKTEVKHNLPRWLTYGKGLVNVKLSSVHDMYQYQSPVIQSAQNDPNLIPGLAQVLSNTDVMVCLEEGTMQLLAHALDIPVVVVDIFKYGTYGGCKNYDEVEKIKTPACYWTNKLEKVGDMVTHALNNPLELRKQRAIVCQQDGGSHLGDPLANAISVVKSCVDRKEIIRV